MQRIENLERMLIFSDAEVHRIYEETKSMHAANLKATLETKAMVSSLTAVMTKLLQALAQGDLTEDYLIEKIFECKSEDDNAAKIAMEATKSQAKAGFPTDEDLVDETIIRIESMSLSNLQDKDKALGATFEELRNRRKEPLGKNYAKQCREMQKHRITEERKSDVQVKKTFEDMIKKRAPTPIVDCPTVNFMSTDEEVDNLKSLLDTEEIKGKQDRRHGKSKPVAHQKRILEIRKNQPGQVLNKNTIKESSEEIDELEDDDFEPEEPPMKMPSPKPSNQAKKKVPTARKSTTATPRKRKEKIEKLTESKEVVDEKAVGIKQELIDQAEADKEPEDMVIAEGSDNDITFMGEFKPTKVLTRVDDNANAAATSKEE